MPLADAVQARAVQGHFEPKYILRGLEVYWEFATMHPVSTVDLLSPKLTAAVNHSRVTSRAVTLPTSEVIQQSRSVQLDLGRDMWVRVYAKTNKRVRFEVIFGSNAITAANGRLTTSNPEALTRLVDELVKRASQRMTELFREMRPPYHGTVNTKTTEDLLRAIGKSHANPDVTAQVLHGLRHFSRVAPEGDPSLLEALQRLKRQRVLRIIRPHHSWYALTPQYESALSSLVARHSD